MMLAILTYLLLTLQDFNLWIIIGLVLYFVVLLVSFVMAVTYWEHVSVPFKDFIKDSAFYSILNVKLAAFFIVLASVIPSDNTVKWVLGAYVAQSSATYLVNHEEYSKLPENVTKAANMFLEQYITKEGDINEKTINN